MNIDMIAEICHEANRVQQRYAGETVDPPWADAPGWQRESTTGAVRAILDGTVSSPRQSHEEWMRQRLAAGWTLGPVRDTATKTSPCLVDYDQLPTAQRNKDTVFFALARLASK